MEIGVNDEPPFLIRRIRRERKITLEGWKHLGRTSVNAAIETYQNFGKLGT